MRPKNNVFSKWKILMLVAVVALVSFGCGSQQGTVQKQVTLTIWDPFMNSEDVQPLLESYRQKHTNVTINYVKKDIGTYESDLLDALASGNGPDIFSINNSWLPRYVDKATSAPSSIFNMRDYKSTFVDVVAQDFTRNNHIYGVAMSVDSLALYYNKDLMGSASIATPPKTWDELSAQVQRIKKLDKTGYFNRSGVALGTNSNINRAVDILYLFMLQQGTVPFLSDNTTPAFDQSIQKNGETINPAETALDFYTSFASPLSPNYNWNTRSDYSIDAFANGRVAYLLSYSYARETILQKSPNLNFDVAPVPQPNLEDSKVNFANYWGQIVSKQSINSGWAWDLLKFLTSKESLDKYYASNKVPSSRRDLISLQTSDPEIGVFADANLTAKDFYRPDQAAMDKVFGNAIDSVILRGNNVRAAISQAAQQASAISRPR